MAAHRYKTRIQMCQDFLTFNCPLKEDFTASTGEDSIMAARSFIRAHQTDLVYAGPGLSNSRGCGSAVFRPETHRTQEYMYIINVQEKYCSTILNNN